MTVSLSNSACVQAISTQLLPLVSGLGVNHMVNKQTNTQTTKITTACTASVPEDCNLVFRLYFLAIFSCRGKRKQAGSWVRTRLNTYCHIALC